LARCAPASNEESMQFGAFVRNIHGLDGRIE
jgi:hypothetical protein